MMKKYLYLSTILMTFSSDYGLASEIKEENLAPQPTQFSPFETLPEDNLLCNLFSYLDGVELMQIASTSNLFYRFSKEVMRKSSKKDLEKITEEHPELKVFRKDIKSIINSFENANTYSTLKQLRSLYEQCDAEQKMALAIFKGFEDLSLSHFLRLSLINRAVINNIFSSLNMASVLHPREFVERRQKAIWVANYFKLARVNSTLIAACGSLSHQELQERIQVIEKNKATVFPDTIDFLNSSAKYILISACLDLKPSVLQDACSLLLSQMDGWNRITIIEACKNLSVEKLDARKSALDKNSKELFPNGITAADRSLLIAAYLQIDPAIIPKISALFTAEMNVWDRLNIIEACKDLSIERLEAWKLKFEENSGKLFPNGITAENRSNLIAVYLQLEPKMIPKIHDLFTSKMNASDRLIIIEACKNLSVERLEAWKLKFEENSGKLFPEGITASDRSHLTSAYLPLAPATISKIHDLFTSEMSAWDRINIIKACKNLSVEKLDARKSALEKNSKELFLNGITAADRSILIAAYLQLDLEITPKIHELFTSEMNVWDRLKILKACKNLSLPELTKRMAAIHSHQERLKKAFGTDITSNMLALLLQLTTAEIELMTQNPAEITAAERNLTFEAFSGSVVHSAVSE